MGGYLLLAMTEGWLGYLGEDQVASHTARHSSSASPTGTLAACIADPEHDRAPERPKQP